MVFPCAPPPPPSPWWLAAELLASATNIYKRKKWRGEKKYTKTHIRKNTQLSQLQLPQ
jgi:hypothetical protein